MDGEERIPQAFRAKIPKIGQVTYKGIGIRTTSKFFSFF